MTLAQAFGHLLRHPVQVLLGHFNWKTALFSTLLRCGIYFAVNLSAGFGAAWSALLTEVSYRAVLVGLEGALTQTFRQVQPAWQATLGALLVVPLFGHSVELTVHYLRGTVNLRASFAASVAFTVLATLFTLYAMRQGALVVGGESRPFAEDLKRLPALLAGFVALPFRALLRRR